MNGIAHAVVNYVLWIQNPTHYLQTEMNVLINVICAANDTESWLVMVVLTLGYWPHVDLGIKYEKFVKELQIQGTISLAGKRNLHYYKQC